MKAVFLLITLFSVSSWAQKISIAAAFMQGSTFYASGSGAKANGSILLAGVNVGTADKSGRWSFNRASYVPASDCIARISSGSSSATRAITDCNFSATKTPDYLNMVVVPKPVRVGYDGCDIMVDILPMPDPVYDPLNAIIPSVASGAPSHLTINNTAFSMTNFVCSPTYAANYRTISITASAGTKSVTQNVMFIPMADSWVGSARASTTVAQSQDFCRPNVNDGQDATFASRAIADLREGYIGGGAIGVNPGVEFISAATFASRCAKNFPNGHSVVSTTAATTSVSVVGAEKCVTAKQTWSCNSGTSRNAISHNLLNFLNFDNTIDAQICLANNAASGGVSVAMSYSGGLRGPASVVVPAGSKCINYVVNYSGAGSAAASFGGFTFTASYK